MEYLGGVMESLGGGQAIVGFLVALLFVGIYLWTSLKAARDRKETRRALAVERAMFEKSNVGKTESIAGSGPILRANRAFCRLLGYTQDELRKMSWRDLSHPEDHALASEAVEEMVAEVADGVDPDACQFFVRYKAKGGDYCPAFVNVTYVGTDGPGILLAEVQRTDEFVRKHVKLVADRGIDYVTMPMG